MKWAECVAFMTFMTFVTVYFGRPIKRQLSGQPHIAAGQAELMFNFSTNQFELWNIPAVLNWRQNNWKLLNFS